MANRSYLYAYWPDERPPYRDLAEWKHQIPLLHLLLVGINPRPFPSAFWDHDALAIQGDAPPALALCERFLDWLTPQLPATFAEQKQKALAILHEPARRAPTYHLEIGELLDPDDPAEDHPDANMRMFRHLAASLAREVQRLLDTPGSTLASSPNPYIAEVHQDWEQHLGLYFSKVLYNHYG